MKRLVIDTSGLLLLAVGRADPRYLSYKRVHEYGQEGYRRFAQLVQVYDKMVATPHSLTEAWNLTANDSARDPRSLAIKEQLRVIASEVVEVYEPSSILAQMQDFIRFGFSDAAQLRAAEDYACPIVTSDEKLHIAALSRGLISFHLVEMKMH